MNLPDHAKKVFDGVIFDVYHWEQEMFDGSIETFERLKRPDTVQVIAVQGDKILLAREQQPMHPTCYTLFGGRVDEGEDVEAAAKRELQEEGGLQSDNLELLYQFEPYTKIEWTVHTYVARDCTPAEKGKKQDAGEKIETVTVSFDEFIDIACGKEFRGRELQVEILRLRVEGKLDVLKEKIFGKK